MHDFNRLIDRLSKKLQILVFSFQNCSGLLWEKIVLVNWEPLLKFEAEVGEFDFAIPKSNLDVRTFLEQNVF